MNVFVLCHSGFEDDRDVRGVYASREAAEADIAKGQQYAPGQFSDHSDLCCSVDEMPLLTEPVGWGPEFGPPRPPRPLLPWEQAFLDIYYRWASLPNPYRPLILEPTVVLR